jgi:hypothetical protein
MLGWPERLCAAGETPLRTISHAEGRLGVDFVAKRIRSRLDPAEMAARYGAEPPVLDWRERLVCSKCGSRQVDMVVTGTERR